MCGGSRYMGLLPMLADLCDTVVARRWRGKHILEALHEKSKSGSQQVGSLAGTRHDGILASSPTLRAWAC
jgi:hypothetical protein